jgi:hypothetical protein
MTWKSKEEDHIPPVTCRTPSWNPGPVVLGQTVREWSASCRFDSSRCTLPTLSVWVHLVYHQRTTPSSNQSEEIISVVCGMIDGTSSLTSVNCGCFPGIGWRDTQNISMKTCRRPRPMSRRLRKFFPVNAFMLVCVYVYECGSFSVLEHRHQIKQIRGLFPVDFVFHLVFPWKVSFLSLIPYFSYGPSSPMCGISLCLFHPPVCCWRLYFWFYIYGTDPTTMR